MAATFKLVPAQIPANAPYLNPVVTQEEAWAIKALIAGKANEAEQGIATRFIMGVLSAVSSLPYFPDPHDTAFMNGRRYIGHHLIRIAQLPPGSIAKLKKFNPTSPGGEDDEMPTI